MTITLQRRDSETLQRPRFLAHTSYGNFFMVLHGGGLMQVTMDHGTVLTINGVEYRCHVVLSTDAKDEKFEPYNPTEQEYLMRKWGDCGGYRPRTHVTMTGSARDKLLAVALLTAEQIVKDHTSVLFEAEVRLQEEAKERLEDEAQRLHKMADTHSQDAQKAADNIVTLERLLSQEQEKENA